MAVRTKVDAKLELARVMIQHEIDRLKALTTGHMASDAERRGRIDGLKFAINALRQVEDTTR